MLRCLSVWRGKRVGRKKQEGDRQVRVGGGTCTGSRSCSFSMLMQTKRGRYKGGLDRKRRRRDWIVVCLHWPTWNWAVRTEETSWGGQWVEGVEQLQAHWSGLLDREPGQANHRLIQRRRVYVYTSASVFVHVEVCLHWCVYLWVCNWSELLWSIVTVHLSKSLSQPGTKLR